MIQRDLWADGIKVALDLLVTMAQAAFLVSLHPGQTALSLRSYLPYDVESASSQG